MSISEFEAAIVSALRDPRKREKLIAVKEAAEKSTHSLSGLEEFSPPGSALRRFLGAI